MKILNFAVLCSFLVFLSSTAFAKPMIKLPNVAGQFYSDNAQKLSRHIHDLLSQAKADFMTSPVDVIIVPHAGLVYSGPVAAHAFSAVSQKKI